MKRFKLRSPYEPTGDQPQAIEKLVKGIKNNLKCQGLLGVTGSGKTFTVACVIEQIQKPTLIISHNKTLAAQLASELGQFFPENAVCYFVSYYDYYQPEAYIPQTDTYIAKDASINEEIDRLRHTATQSLLTRNDVIIVASVSCIYGLGSPQNYEEVKLTIKQSQKVKRDDLLRKLTDLYYTRNDLDFHRGTFRVRGDIVEIFPSYSEDKIIRVEFFGDEIERISEVNFLTGKTINNKQLAINVFPASHYITVKKNIPNILDQIKEELKQRVRFFKEHGKLLEAQRLEQRTNFDLEMIKETGFCHGIENYSRYFDGRSPGQPPFTLLNYFPKDYLLFIDESHMTVPQIEGMFLGDKARKDVLVEHGFRLPSAYDNRPLTFSEFEKRMSQTTFVSATPAEYERKKSKQIVEQLLRPTGLLDPSIKVKPTKNQIDDLIDQIRKRVKKKQRVLVTTLTKRMAEELADYLAETGIKVRYLHSEIPTLERPPILRDLRLGKYDVVVGINLLREGLDLPEVSLVVILDADKEGYLRSETALIQVMGRAARHKDGQAIMYADQMTGSMKRAIEETNRRRRVQEEYNKKHGIVPRSIKKEIREGRLAGVQAAPKPPKLELKDIAKQSLPQLIKHLQFQMDLFARNLEFEKAAEIRDQIAELKKIKKD